MPDGASVACGRHVLAVDRDTWVLAACTCLACRARVGRTPNLAGRIREARQVTVDELLARPKAVA